MENGTSVKMVLMISTNIMACMCCRSAFAEGVELELV